jgi:hypothetical protein
VCPVTAIDRAARRCSARSSAAARTSAIRTCSLTIGMPMAIAVDQGNHSEQLGQAEPRLRPAVPLPRSPCAQTSSSPPHLGLSIRRATGGTIRRLRKRGLVALGKREGKAGFPGGRGLVGRTIPDTRPDTADAYSRPEVNVPRYAATARRPTGARRGAAGAENNRTEGVLQGLPRSGIRTSPVTRRRPTPRTASRPPAGPVNAPTSAIIFTSPEPIASTPRTRVSARRS